jgi:DNA-binding MarR family transcriptional regulator
MRVNNLFESNSQQPGDLTREDILQQLFDRMFSLMKQIHREIHQDVGHPELALSPPQARLIFTIARNNERGLSVKELARMTNMTPGAITQFVDVLIEKNLVTREEDLKDRRIVILKLTPSARGHMDLFRKQFLTYAARKFDVLSIEELTQLYHLLIRVTGTQGSGEPPI